ncbi:DUF1501 domain-containing protein [uncultured Vibrio sp.]|uniref:DUF1501 domain-containing protein n=1 Tax=uncultured Vibrio sp. TaxID=114054 RepID=UPI00091FEE41|nr:DUF1501 domain-containing protein [uncultured Vibrio sp.]OIQ24947.1 MAG: hypothetical protein BM561_07675 [Vibrio sp. MedPE-SWchi]
MPMTRRSFLKGATSTAATGLVPISLSIPVSSAFANEQGGYKALVCLFLHGGNDSFNMIVPTDSDNYAKYQTARPDIHLTSSEILAIPNSESAQGIGINGSMPNIANLLNLGQAAAVVNVGTLVEPTNKNNLYDVKKPPNLGAHNKQQAAWQSSWGDGSYHSYGWAGMMMDVIGNESAIVSDSMSFAGNELLSGARSKDISISSDGVRAMDALGHSGAVNNNFTKLVNAPYGSVFKQEYIARLTGILDFQQELEQLLTTYPEDTSIPDSSLGLQFRMVRRMIQSASELGHSRQVFFVNLGGFDNHSNQRGRQDGLFATIDQAVSAFHASLAELGLEDSVITSTMSDFGRTIENNSKAGTDHGWGSNQLVVGHAVNGGKSYGSMPDFVKDGQDGYGNKFIPSQSSEQLAATLCRWMGLSEAGVDVIFPSLLPSNINAFSSRYLGVVGDYQQEGQETELAIQSVMASETRANHTPQMAVDGDPLTKWTAKGKGIQYVIELAQSSTVTKLLYSQAKGDVRQYLFDIEVSSDGVNYQFITSVLSPGTSTGMIEQALLQSSVKNIRLTCNGNNGDTASLVLWNNFQELKVLGY